MKKLFNLLLLVALTLCVVAPAGAQTTLISTNNGLSVDTVTNTGVRILSAKVVGYRSTVTITANLTKISGTLGGTLVPVVSNDGVKYYEAPSYTASDTAFTVTNVAAQGKAYQCKLGYQYYGVQWTGTGTMSGSITASLIARRPND